jgi:hypothetical protein
MEQKDFITVWPIFSINKKIVALLNIIGINWRAYGNGKIVINEIRNFITIDKCSFEEKY